jgi:uncharacterized repeat protein (TIGR03837 family)
MAPPLWDLFCRVVDHRGDAGVGWRLARNLALRDQRARLWIDDPTALDGMADADDARLVERGALCWRHWDAAAERAFDDIGFESTARVVETFGCGLPPGVLRTMARRPDPPPWINLEYLSAEAYVERSHRLPSPHPAAATGLPRDLTCWFFYPGFTAATGGLLREPGLAQPGGERPTPPDILQRLPGPGPRISLFHYALPPLARWQREFMRAQAGAAQPQWIRCGAAVATSGAAAAEAGSDGEPIGVPWPWLPQSLYDRLLRACDLNIVRGEDSFVRAQWAARPFIWHVYRQHDGAHRAKLEAFLDRFLAPIDAGDGSPALDASLAADIRQAFRGLNGFDEPDRFAAALVRCWERRDAWQRHCERWRAHLWRQPDLATQLIAFAAEVAAR